MRALGKVSFAVSCSPEAGRRFRLRHGVLGPGAERLGQSLRRRPHRSRAQPRRRGGGPGGVAVGEDSAGAGVHRGGGRALSRSRVATFYALALDATAPKTDTTFAQQKRAAAILNPLFARYPQHPGLAHYIIHSTDSHQVRDSSARATVALSSGVPEGKTIVGDYNRTAMAARIPLETGDWRLAANFPVAPVQSVGTLPMLSRFTRALGAARSGDPAAA